MAPNDVEIDEVNDVGQVQVLDCQVCCQPIEMTVTGESGNLSVQVEQENA